MNKSRTLVLTLEEIGVKYGATAAQVALNWVINSHGETIATIPGVTKVRQAQINAGLAIREPKRINWK